MVPLRPVVHPEGDTVWIRQHILTLLGRNYFTNCPFAYGNGSLSGQHTRHVPKVNSFHSMAFQAEDAHFYRCI